MRYLQFIYQDGCEACEAGRAALNEWWKSNRSQYIIFRRWFPAMLIGNYHPTRTPTYILVENGMKVAVFVGAMDLVALDAWMKANAR